MIDSPEPGSVPLVSEIETPTWSTPKFFAIVLAVHFVMIFLLNGVLNEELHLGVPSAAIGAAPVFVTVLLLPRWTVFARWRTRGSH